MKKCRALLLLSITGMLTLASPATTANAKWQNTANGQMFTQKASPGYVTGWKKTKKYTYYFNSNGILQTGFQNITVNSVTNLYYFNQMGQLQFGWIKTTDGKTYYAKKDGTIVTGRWVKKRYMQADGSMAVNTWINGKWVGADGLYTGIHKKIGWITTKAKKTYYFDSGSNKVKGRLALGGNTYYLNPATGVLMKGCWINIGGKYYYAGSTTGAFEKNVWKGNTYLTSDGSRASGWTTINGTDYYFSPSTGAKETGWLKLTVDGTVKKYCLGSDGKLRKNCWIVSNQYYASNTGELLTGLQTVNGNLYFFRKSGKKVTSKKKAIGSDTYYFQSDGSAAVNKWAQISSKYYYFEADGKMAKNKWIGNYFVDPNGVRTNQTKKTGWQTIDGKKYYFDNNGSMMLGWQTISGATYYFDSNGVMLTGIQTINPSGKKYYFYSSGQMAVSTTIAVGTKQYTINASGVVTSEESIKISGDTVGVKIVNFALQYVGNPYVYGGTSLTKGADCSGFVQTVFSNFNIKLLRVADDQMKGPSASYISNYGYKKAVVVETSSMQPGDLVFYGAGNYASHVGIYIGNGQIVHASNSQPYPQGGIKISNYDYQTPIRIVRYWS